MKELLIITQVLLCVVGYCFYFSSMKKKALFDIGVTIPQLGTWIIFASLDMAIASTSLIADKAYSAIVPAVYGICAIAVIALIVKREIYVIGSVKEFRFCIILGFTGIIAGIAFRNELYSEIAFLIALASGTYLTAKKVWHNPFSEDRLSWLLWMTTNIIFVVGTFSIPERTWITWLVPVSYLFVNLMVTGPLIIRRFFVRLPAV